MNGTAEALGCDERSAIGGPDMMWCDLHNDTF